MLILFFYIFMERNLKFNLQRVTNLFSKLLQIFISNENVYFNSHFIFFFNNFFDLDINVTENVRNMKFKCMLPSDTHIF